MNKLAKLMRNTGPARFFVPVGVILIVFGILTLGHNTKNFVETTGTVTKVEECAPVEGEAQQYDVYVAYTVDGGNYTAMFANLVGEYKTGDEIKVFYNPDDPKEAADGQASPLFSPILIVVGIAALAFGVLQTVKSFKKSKLLDETGGSQLPAAEFDGFKTAPGVTEYYVRFDGNTLKPGYIVEDADRKVLYEGKMTRQALVGSRVFEFTNHVTGHVEEHEVGHTVTQSYNDEMFSAKSWFKLDGENIWDVLHGKGLRMATDLGRRFPNLTYNIAKDGRPFAVAETSGKYVHEDDAAQHKMNVPVGRYYYRVWTASAELDTLFLAIFAISETEQTMVE